MSRVYEYILVKDGEKFELMQRGPTGHWKRKDLSEGKEGIVLETLGWAMEDYGAIDKFIDEHEELMDDLAQVEEMEKLK